MIPSHPQESRHVTLLAAGARTTTGSSGEIKVGRFTSLLVMLTVNTVTGTSPTLDVYLQMKCPDDTTWHDMAHFAQVTSSNNKQLASLATSGNSIRAVQTAALGAGTIRSDTVLGSTWRIHWVIGGTNPNFNFGLICNAYR